jgi:hypothetical protein
VLIGLKQNKTSAFKILALEKKCKRFDKGRRYKAILAAAAIKVEMKGRNKKYWD